MYQIVIVGLHLRLSNLVRWQEAKWIQQVAVLIFVIFIAFCLGAEAHVYVPIDWNSKKGSC
jgi:hypothetical protein